MPKYDRELIARMLLGPRVFSPESVAEQARLLRKADNLEADARSVVREVPDGMVLVPREPTREMIEAGVMFGNSPNKVSIIYQSMVIAAASDHQQNAAQGGGD